MIRLLKPLEYYEKKYGTWMYGLNKLRDWLVLNWRPIPVKNICFANVP